MEQQNNEIIELNQSLQENDFFTSFENSENLKQNEIMQKYEDINRYITARIPMNNQKAIVAVASEDIHVGNIIYHHVQNQVKIQNIEIEQKLQETTSATISSDFISESKLNKWFNGENKKRNFLIMAIAIFSISLSAVIAYFILNFAADNENPQSNYTSTTSNIITDDNLSSTFSTITTSLSITTLSTTTLISTTTENSPSDFLITREEWNANSPNANISKLSIPIKRIIVAHTGGEYCYTENECKKLVKEIQLENSHLDDIPYNFLIGEDGKVYEGRGFEYEGQHTENLYASEFNSIGICIAFIGSYINLEPSDNQMRVFTRFISFYSSNGLIDANYKIFAQDDLMHRNDEALALRDTIRRMTNFYNLRKVYRREEWNAAIPKGDQNKFDRVTDMTILTHTVTDQCFSLNECAAICQDIQNTNFDSGLNDFAFGFAIGDNGLVLEGLGWDVIGNHLPNYNSISVGIAVIGNFSNVEPIPPMYDTLANFLDDGYALGKLTDDFKLYRIQDLGLPSLDWTFTINIYEWCRYGNRSTPSQTPCTSDDGHGGKVFASFVIFST